MRFSRLFRNSCLALIRFVTAGIQLQGEVFAATAMQCDIVRQFCAIAARTQNRNTLETAEILHFFSTLLQCHIPSVLSAVAKEVEGTELAGKRPFSGIVEAAKCLAKPAEEGPAMAGDERQQEEEYFDADDGDVESEKPEIPSVSRALPSFAKKEEEEDSTCSFFGGGLKTRVPMKLDISIHLEGDSEAKRRKSDWSVC